jgi:hypothetical protein
MVLIPYHELLLSFYDYFMDFKFADQFQMVYFLHIDIYIYIYIFENEKKKCKRLNSKDKKWLEMNYIYYLNVMQRNSCGYK